MNKSIISVENLGKKYYIGVNKTEKQTLLIKRLAELAITPFRRLFNSRLAWAGTDKVEEIWALSDVSFDLQQGEVLGIIGENGSGKSTLLKIISQITSPTQGRVTLRGRIGSLLEVGIGFHPNLTGRENVYLSGAIQGMRKTQINQIFDEIVDFSGVERFIDTPVKYYSSGMYVRLAFSVAAHLDPDILILDEVLAVGDTNFQKKCMEKMERLVRDGRTVLFVSHGMNLITRLCNKGLYLDDGKVKYWGSAKEAVSIYLRSVQKIDEERLLQEKESQKESPAFVELKDQSIRAPWATHKIIKWASTHKENGEMSVNFFTGDKLIYRMGFESEEERIAYGQLNFMDFSGTRVMQVNITHNGEPLVLKGKGTIDVQIEDLRLVTGDYIIMFDLYSNPQKEPLLWRDSVGDTIHIKVELGDYVKGKELTQGHVVFAQKSLWKVG